MPINVKIENFEGPFDLLLHLVKDNEMDIYTIKIYEITDQYMQYIKNMRDMDLEVTSEFIVIAATLLEIKSSMLLPKPKKDDDENEEDSGKIMLQKLVKYKKFKRAAQYLQDRQDINGVMVSKDPEIIDDLKEDTDDNILNGISITKLYNIYVELMKRYSQKQNPDVEAFRKIPVDQYKIEDKIEFIKGKLLDEKRFLFDDITKECKDKLEVIVSFLAMLELAKMKQIRIYQEKIFENIFIEGVM